jgi:predicted transcriptional regulator
MKVLSLKLKDEVFSEAEKLIEKIHVSRNAYINQALAFYNKVNKRRLLRNQLEKESRAARAVSLEVLREMEKLDDDFGV